MSITSKSVRRGLRYHVQAYHFVFAALRLSQQKLGRAASRASRAGSENLGSERSDESDDDVRPAFAEDLDDEPVSGHINGRELLAGIRELALQQFGLMTNVVFRSWGVHSTDDFGRIVFELIERGEMRKTDRDHVTDFFDVYDFEDVFDRNYRIDTRHAFRRQKMD
jgi:uncharacterized repeat protein (TIGR04138 family)